MKDCFKTVKDHKDNYENKIVKVVKDKWSIVIWKHLELYERIYSLNMKDSIITMKDHKDNYENNKLDKVSKKILTEINVVLREKI